MTEFIQDRGNQHEWPEPGSPLAPVQKKRGHKSTDIPRIKLISWAGAESVLWSVVAAHLVKWAVSFGYFALFQVRYVAPQYGPLAKPYTIFYLKDLWDRLPVHVANLLDQPWFKSQAEPLWWITWRHDIRDVTISVVGTVIVRLMFVKPKYPVDDKPGWKVYLVTVPLAFLLALIPIAIVGVLAWKLPYLTHHGLHVPDRYGPWAAEANGWIEAGQWITVLMGILGGLAASLVIQRVADDIQWFFAERSAAKIRSESTFTLTGTKVIGTPAHRKRVHWLLENRPELAKRNPWLVRGLLALGLGGLLASGAGAWLNLVGPAKPK